MERLGHGGLRRPRAETMAHFLVRGTTPSDCWPSSASQMISVVGPTRKRRPPTRRGRLMREIFHADEVSGTAHFGPLHPSPVAPLCYAPTSAWEHQSTILRNSTMRGCDR